MDQRSIVLYLIWHGDELSSGGGDHPSWCPNEQEEIMNYFAQLEAESTPSCLFANQVTMVPSIARMRDRDCRVESNDFLSERLCSGYDWKLKREQIRLLMVSK
jgi:hypothetical protein